MFAPVPLTVADIEAPLLSLALIVNGPTIDPAGPLSTAGVIVRLGGGGCVSGPALRTAETIAAVALCIGSDVLSTYRSVKNQTAACTAAALSAAFVKDAGSFVAG
jgi:hypothetical protein